MYRLTVPLARSLRSSVVRVVPPEDRERESFPRPSLSFWWFASNHWRSFAGWCISLISAFIFTLQYHYRHTYLCPNFPFFIRIAPLRYSCLENPMDGRNLIGCSPGVAKSRTWLSDFTFTFHFHALEKEMATHSSVLAWRIPGGALWAAVYVFAQSRTRLKRLSSSSSSIRIPVIFD